MKKTPRNSINDGWRTTASLRRAAFVLLAIFALFTFFNVAPNSAIAADNTSPNGTRGKQIVDGMGVVWTFSGEKTLRAGVWVGEGNALEYLYTNNSVYAIASDNSIWRWTGTNWTSAGSDISAVQGPASGGSAASNNLRIIVTTGSISGGSNQISVASASGFAVGDWVIVEIGKEAGQGQTGTRGVGGTWPAKSYPTEAQLLADRSQPDRLHAWAEDTGYAYWWLDGVWYDLAPNRPNTFYTGQYYLGKAIPRSLQARITAISGNTLTLDKSATVSASGANVYLDTAPIISNIIASGGSLSLPAGNYPTGGVVWIRDKGGFVLSGQGKDQTRIYSPKGVPSAMIQAYNSPSTMVRDLTLQGNFRDQGFGMNWTGSTTAGTNEPVTEYNVPQGAAFPRGILMHVASNNSVVQDVHVIDVAQQAVGVTYADNVWARRVVNIQNDLLRQYVQWQFQWAASTGGGCEDCEVRSNYLISGFEAFKSTNTQFIRPKGINAMFAMNGSGGWLIEGADLRFTANSLPPESDRYAASPWHPVVNINTNIGVTPQTDMGGTIRNMTIIQSGYLNATDSLKGVNVNDRNPNIRVEGLAYYAPDYKSGSASEGPLGMNSVGPSTTVNGVQVVGKPQPGRANIFIMYGGGVNCSAQVVEGCNTGSFTTPLMQAFLAGDTSGWTLPSGSSGNTESTGGGSSAGSGSGSSGTPTPPPPPSANGTRGAQVVDSTGGVWTFDGTKTLRNGVWMSDGNASEYLYVNSTVYAIGSDGSLWKWNNGWSYAGNDIAALTGGSSGSGSSGSGSSGSGSSGSGSSGSGSSGSGSSGSGSTTPTPSPNGTRGTQVVDSTGGVWTFNGTQTLRNGVWMGQGNASEYLYVNSTVYAIASDGTLWKWDSAWSYAGTDIAALTGGSSGSGSSGSGSSGSGSTGSGSSGSGSSGSGSSGSGSSGSGSSGSGSSTPTPSANGTRGKQIVDSTAAVWTFNGTQTMRNGVWMSEGNASEYLFVNNTVYAIGSDGSLWKWNNGWSYAGTDIGALGGSSGSGSSSGTATTSPNGTRGKQVVDAAGAVWTFDGTKTLRDGVWMSEGNASEYLYVNSTVYAIGSDGSLWKWNNGWSFAGTDIAALTGGSSSNGGTGTSTEPKKPSVTMDFSGNGTSSVLWRNDSAGQNVIWSIEKGAVAKQAFITGAGSNWDIVGSGDFNADGKADILWRDDEGNVAIWLMNDISVAGGGVVANAPKNWKVEGVGDLNGDGKADILWRASDGSVSVWLMDNVAIAARATLVNVPNTWTVSGIGDLNKDGNADIVWRNSDGSIVTWLMNGATITQMITTGTRSAAWSIVGVADFNGDGKADILWRNTTNGQNGVWYMDGGKQSGSLTIPALADTKWKVVGTGDYNGDGKADIMWRHSQTGDNAIWVMNGAAVTKPAIPAVNDANWVVVKP